MAGDAGEGPILGIWMALWQLIAQLSVVPIQDLGDMFQPDGQVGQPKWAGELTIEMMQFTMALSRCGINANDQQMLVEAVKTLQDLKVHFTFPQDRIGISSSLGSSLANFS